MAKKEKMLCKWKEDDINKNFEKFSDIVRNPKFVCKKCGRVADKKNGCTSRLRCDRGNSIEFNSFCPSVIEGKS